MLELIYSQISVNFTNRRAVVLFITKSALKALLGKSWQSIKVSTSVLITQHIIVVDLKRFDISCPHCALVEQEMAASIGKNFRFLYRQNPPDNLDCATVKLKLIPNLSKLCTVLIATFDWSFRC